MEQQGLLQADHFTLQMDRKPKAVLIQEYLMLRKRQIYLGLSNDADQKLQEKPFQNSIVEFNQKCDNEVAKAQKNIDHWTNIIKGLKFYRESDRKRIKHGDQEPAPT